MSRNVSGFLNTGFSLYKKYLSETVLFKLKSEGWVGLSQKKECEEKHSRKKEQPLEGPWTGKSLVGKILIKDWHDWIVVSEQALPNPALCFCSSLHPQWYSNIFGKFNSSPKFRGPFVPPSVSFLHGVLIVYLVMLGDKLLSLPSVAYLYFILPGFFSFSFARLR